MKKPRYLFWVIFVVLFSAFSVAGWQLHLKSSSPEFSKKGLTVAPPSVHLQRKSSDDPATRHIKLKLTNDGRFRIKIIEISASCGCTVVGALEKRELQQGDYTLLDVHVTIPDTGERNARLKIRFESDELREVVVPITLVGAERIVPFVHFFPEQFEIRGFKFDDIRQQHFELVAVEHLGSPPWLLGLECETMPIRVTTRITKEEPHAKGEIRRTYLCDIVVDENAFKSSLSTAWLQPRFRDPQPATSANVRLSIQQVPAVRAVPAELFINKDQATRLPIERRIILINETDDAFEATVGGSNPWIDVEQLPKVQDGPCVFLVRIRANAESKDSLNNQLQGEIRLKTTLTAAPEIRVPLTIELP